LLYAQSLECLGRFLDAENAYLKVVSSGRSPFLARCGLRFCKRMSADGRAGTQSVRESDYRLHAELMNRGQDKLARFVAMRLLPDAVPLQLTIAEQLRRLDPGARLTVWRDHSRVDVRLTKATPEAVALLKGVPIGELSITGSGVQDIRSMTGLDIRSLNLAMNPLCDLEGCPSLNLQQLNLSDTSVVDIGALRKLMLKELNLAHTRVDCLAPLASCPIESLDLTGSPIRDIRPLRSVALHRLALSRTQVSDLSALSSLPLEELSLDRTMIYSLQPLAGLKLTHLRIAYTAVKDLSPLAGMPLVELDLRGCSILTDLTPLASCTSLEKIYLPAHLQAFPTLRQLPRLKFVEYEGARKATSPISGTALAAGTSRRQP